MNYRLSAVTLVASALCIPAAAGTRPQFEDYAVAERFDLPAAPVDLNSHPQARRFRTALREGAAKGPNFAGHFTVVSWGCGTNCQVIAVVDAETGKVRFPDFGSEIGQEFRRDSRLLISNPPSVVSEYL